MRWWVLLVFWAFIFGVDFLAGVECIIARQFAWFLLYGYSLFVAALGMAAATARLPWRGTAQAAEQ